MSDLELQNVTKRYGQAAVVDRVSFAVKQGECTALLGPSGCGKTTTLRIVAGFETPDAGVVLIDGNDVVGKRPYERDIGMVFQDYALFPHMTVAQNVDYGMKRRGVGGTEREQRRAEMLRLTKLEGLETRRPAQLSGGQQQRVALARALATHPKLMLLDEPLSNLDAKLRVELRAELRQILGAVGITSVMVTHDQAEAMAMADRIVLLDRGQVRQIGTPQDLYERPRDRFTAEFVGRCNWIDGKVTGGGTGGWSFVSACGSIALQLPATAAAREGPYVLMIRPERLRIADADTPAAPGSVAVPARVTATEYLGADLTVLLESTSGLRFEVALKAGGAMRPVAGDVVSCLIAAADCVALAGTNHG
jgi:ABC-type Fe3+/spermidine/putrescine transport system ATPase subunit